MVTKWTRRSTTFDRALGDILMGTRTKDGMYIIPGYASTWRRQGVSLWQVAVQIVETTHVWSRTQALTDAIKACTAETHSGTVQAS